MQERLKVAILWHMHQPCYVDPKSNVLSMPWVRLHAVKDYLDMVKILEDFPKAKAMFNLTPVLMEQIEGYANGTLTDKHMIISRKKAGRLNSKDIEILKKDFFMANWDTMVKPYPRYWELLNKVQRGMDMDKQDWLDLMVWFNLVWIDPIFISGDETLHLIRSKGMNFTETEKDYVLDFHIKILKEILPTYKRMQDEGHIEITTTPFYHPIIPLLCNQESAKVALPNMKLPKKPFGDASEDAYWHLKESAEYYEKTFGRPVRGLWPSEGSVSEDLIPLAAKAGFKWFATDEEILFRSLGVSKSSGVLFKPYSLQREDADMTAVFRDRVLSDRIGFVYRSWPPQEAVADLIKDLKNIKAYLRDKAATSLVTIVLDGENAWEYYPNDGRDFLVCLYQQLSEDADIETVLISDFIEQNPPVQNISRLFAGSWIYANFATWIGHRQKNLGWKYLAETRDMLLSVEQEGSVSQEKLNEAKRELMISEGSDWFWWYGDDHNALTDAEFDRLFRTRLSKIYRLLDKDVPPSLRKSIIR